MNLFRSDMVRSLGRDEIGVENSGQDGIRERSQERELRTIALKRRHIWRLGRETYLSEVTEK